MRIAIVGAGAMGTLLGHGLCKAGYNVTLIDLPARVAQIRAAGKIIVLSPDGRQSAAMPAAVTTDYSLAGKQDVVILAVKAQDLAAIAPGLSQIIGDTTTIVTIQNGIPWWYLQGLPDNFGQSRIPCLDPDGALERSIDPSRIVGCVAYPAAMLEDDGSVRHVEGLRFPVGELDGSDRERTQRLVRMFENAGFKSRVIDDIRSEIWLKAWGAIPINPLSALTRATMVDICSNEQTRALIEKMMGETRLIAEAFGAKFRHTMEKRIEGAKAVGAHKTSMLQDVEAGRELELDALLLAVLELGDLAGVDAPTIRSIYACTALLNEGLRATEMQYDAVAT